MTPVIEKGGLKILSISRQTYAPTTCTSRTNGPSGVAQGSQSLARRTTMPCVLTFVSIVVGYTIESIGVLSGDNESRGFDLNELPVRAGCRNVGRHACGAMEHQTSLPAILIDLENISFQGAPTSVALGVNNLFPSAVVGSHTIAPNQPTPVLWELSGRTTLPTLAGGAGGIGEATGVNGAKVIVGWSRDASGTKLACRWTATPGWTVQSLGTLGGPSSSATRINEIGTIVGRADVAAG